MFEKEAEERCSIIDALTEEVIRDVDSVESYKLGKLDGFKDGAIFGYNIGYRKAMTIRTEIEQAEKDKVVKL